MKTDELDQIIKDYLAATDTDYAIMINGEWGSGKSYYIKHGFDSLVKSILVPINENEDQSRKWYERKKDYYYKPAYISLYGVSSVEDFEVRVFYGINSWANNGFIRVGGLLGSKIGEFVGVSSGKKDAKAITYIRKNRVLVFDDLERICDDKIPVKEVLGLINSYAEHSHFKVVVVCNENHYESEKTSEDVKKDYKTYKEKSVRFTYNFAPDVAAVFDTMVQKLSGGKYRDFLKEEKSSILSLFRIGGEKNLRTLRFFIDTFGKLFGECQKAKYKERATRLYLVTFMLYACEYKKGHHSDDLELLDMRGYKIDLGSFLGSSRNDVKDESDSQKDYVTLFKETYSEVFAEFRPSHLLVEYISSGGFDANRFHKELTKLDDELSRMEIKEEGMVYQKLMRMTELDDNEVKPLIAEMVSYVKEDRYNLYDILHVYALLLKYDYWKIAGFELTDELDNDFCASIQCQKDKHKFNNLFEVKTPIFDNSAHNDRQYKKYKAMKDAAMSINWQAKNKDDIADGLVFLQAAEGGDLNKLRSYRDNSDSGISVSGLDWKRIIELIETAPNPVACEICECIIYFTSRPVRPDDRDKIEDDVIPLLNKYLEGEDKLIRNVYISELRSHLVGVVE